MDELKELNGSDKTLMGSYRLTAMLVDGNWRANIEKDPVGVFFCVI
ncbi:hypothetical protein PghCCS26_09860 [Paenibacillus glycanilyticus]|uniref:Uncharacterized protein n=1 Tax=Paenibacillus glycanilyticus TaxID=126569 RepID=A0ABQ6NIJ6_9BACL|nr:hypothetical protein PghCCS26_09860 [Paenibacillus glycanilyticus]